MALLLQQIQKENINVEIDSKSNKNNLLESGGNSSWGNAPVQGIVMIEIKTTGLKNAQTYIFLLF